MLYKHLKKILQHLAGVVVIELLGHDVHQGGAEWSSNCFCLSFFFFLSFSKALRCC